MTENTEKRRGTPPPLDEIDRRTATLIAKHVRNNLEQLHGGGNLLDHSDEGGQNDGLTDEQMRYINPIVRNSVADVLHALNNQDRRAARLLLDFCSFTPEYWEPAELTEGYLSLDWSKS